MSELLFYEGEKHHHGDYPLLKGADIDRYSLSFNENWLIHDFEKHRTEESVVQVYLDLALVPVKILTRQTSDRIQAAADYEQYVTAKSIHTTIVEAEDYNPLYVVSVLNSKLLSYTYQIRTGEVGRLFAQVKLYDLRKLPIRRIHFTTPPGERTRLVGVGITEATEWIETAEKDSVTFSAFSGSKLARWLAARLSAEPEQADAVHDLLAHLAQWMIDMNKAKGAEVRGFLAWLADYTGLPVDDWALKTHLRRYYEHDWPAMQRVLKRNQRKLPRVELDVDAYKNEPAARICAAWETSMDTLRPLLADIAATDRLIDQIVYQLYGLTEEEIAIVEGRA